MPAVSCEVCGRTLELDPSQSPVYRRAIESGWRLEYRGVGWDARISAKCDLCRTRSMRMPRFPDAPENRQGC